MLHRSSVTVSIRKKNAFLNHVGASRSSIIFLYCYFFSSVNIAGFLLAMIADFVGVIFKSSFFLTSIALGLLFLLENITTKEPKF